MNFNINIFALLIALLFSSCSSEQTELPPTDLIPRDNFIQLLVDMNKIEAARSMHTSKEKDSKIATEAFYINLWEEHQISQNRFDESFTHYRKDLTNMASMYQEVADILKREEDEVNEAKRKRNQLNSPANSSEDKKD